MVKDETVATLLLDFELTIATELDDGLLELGVLELGTLELFTLELAVLVATDELLVPHKVPFTFGAPAVPVA